MPDDLDQLIARRRFEVRFQPVVDLGRHAVLGHAVSGWSGSGGGTDGARALRAAAAGRALTAELELALLGAARARAATLGITTPLFVELCPELLDLGEALLRDCLAAGAGGAALVLCFAGGELGGLRGARLATLERLRDAGVALGLAHLGQGAADLKVWASLRPAYVMLDPYFTAPPGPQAAPTPFTRSFVELGRAMGSRVIAGEVHDAQHAHDLAELGIDAASGAFFGLPGLTPPDPSEAIALLALLAEPDAVDSAHELVRDVPPIAPNLLIRDFVRLLYEQPERDAFPVVDEAGVPLGVIWRNAFLLHYSKPLHPEILAKKPVSCVMDTAPLLIDARLRLEQVSRLVTRKSRVHLTEQFIITRAGRYAGLGQTIDLLHHITRAQIERAAHSNPLTGLPGNIPINERINRLITEQRPFVVAYIDLDHFKPYNDVYGYARGDELLLHVASVLRESVSSRADFLGHLGGDDFVLVMRSADWAERLVRAVDEFARSIAGFYSTEHRASGGIATTDRYGEPRSFGLLTLSAAIVDACGSRFASAAALAQSLQAVKARAKSIPGNSLLYAGPGGDRDLLAGAPAHEHLRALRAVNQ